MLRRRIAGTVCSVALALLGLIVVPGVAIASAPSAASPSPSSATSTDSGGYPAQGPLLTVSSGSTKVGGSVIVTGHGFRGGEPVDLSVTYGPKSHALGSGPAAVAQPAAFTLRQSVVLAVPTVHVIAAGDGTFATQIFLTKAGNATITATGEQSHLSVDATVSVLPAAGAGNGSTSSTSAKSALPFASIELLIGALALVVLLVFLGTAWQRRSRKPSAASNVSTT